jgi:hypothetical protein
METMEADREQRDDVQRVYVVGASKERLATIRDRLLRDGIAVNGHCDQARRFSPPADTAFVLLITDMGCHAALDKARAYCRLTGLPCMGGLWRTWSVTRQRLATHADMAGASCAAGHCPIREAGHRDPER